MYLGDNTFSCKGYKNLFVKYSLSRSEEITKPVGLFFRYYISLIAVVLSTITFMLNNLVYGSMERHLK